MMFREALNELRSRAVYEKLPGEGNLGGGGTTATSNVKKIFGPNNAVIGYEVKYSDGSFDVLTPKEYDNLVQFGSTEAPEEEDGGSGGGSVSGSYYIPNALDYLNSQLSVIEAQLEAAQIAPNDAVRQFNAVAEQIGQQLQAQIANAQLQQGATTQEIDIAANKQDYEIRRQEGNIERGLGIGQIREGLANTRRQAGTSFLQDFAPYALPGNVTSLNLPLLGNVFGTEGTLPLNQFNPDTVFDVPGMNAVSGSLDQIPTIGANPIQYPNVPVPNVPVPQPGQYPTIPNTQVPQIDFAALMAQAGF